MASLKFYSALHDTQKSCLSVACEVRGFTYVFTCLNSFMDCAIGEFLAEANRQDRDWLFSIIEEYFPNRLCNIKNNMSAHFYRLNRFDLEVS